MLAERDGGGARVGTARADGEDVLFRLDDVAATADEQGLLRVGDDQSGFKAAQGAVAAPVFGELDGGARELAAEFFELAFKALEEREGVGATAGEASEDFVFVQAADFADVALHHGVAEGGLAVAAEGDEFIAAHAEDGGGVYLGWVHGGECVRREQATCGRAW